MPLVLDDFCHLFNSPPNSFFSALSQSMEQISTFDPVQYQEFKSLFHQHLIPIGEYEIISYVSGTESIDRSILWTLQENKLTKVYKFKNIYHGSTLLLHEKEMQKSGFDLCFLDFSSSEETCLAHIKAVKNGVLLIEPFFGDFFRVFSEHFFKRLADICSENNLRLLLDETRSGLYHYGEFSYALKTQIQPEVICFAKGLALGVPLAAAAYRKDAFQKVNFKEMNLLATSQSTNSYSMKVSCTLLTHFQSTGFIKDLARHRLLITQLKNDLASLNLFDHIEHTGQLLILNLTLALRSLKQLVFFYKTLTARGLKIRFPENGKLILIFPFDLQNQDYDLIKSVFSELSEKLTPQFAKPI